MKKLLPYLKPYTKECILAPLLKNFEALLELLVPLVVAAIVDGGITEGKGTGYIIKYGLLLVGLGLIGFIASITAQYFSAKAATGFASSVKSVLFSHIQKLTYTDLDGIGAPTLINRLTTDVNQLQTGVNMTLRLMLRSPMVVFGAMVMAFIVDARCAIIFVVMIVLLTTVVVLLMRITIPGHKKIQGKLDTVLHHTRENLTGVRVLRAFNKQHDEMEQFERDNGLLRQIQLKIGQASALMNPLTYILVNGALVVLLYSGALQVDGGALSKGMVIALVNYLSQILVELVKGANTIVSATKGLASAARVESILSVVPEMKDGSQTADADSEEAVAFDHVTLQYASAGADSLEDISFTAFKGQTIGVIGGTGSGKTSLVNMIPRFYDAAKGTVRVFGTDVKEQVQKELRSMIGVVPQKAELFRGTIRENLLWGNGNASDEDLWQALETAQAAEVVRKKEKGLDEMVEQGGRNFSGGQKQRLTIARAMVRKPRILILDDSASALDFATEAALRSALKKMGGSLTVFIVSQRASSVRFADRILVLEDGALVGSGTHDELLAGCPVYREIWESQNPKEVEA